MLAGIRKLAQESELDKGHNKDTVSYESEENVASLGGVGCFGFAEAQRHSWAESAREIPD